MLNISEDLTVNNTRYFYNGDINLIRNSVSVIGSRNCSEKSKIVTRNIAEYLVHNNYTVMSGLAKGIDYEAHTAAIEAGGKTIAVLGTPLNRTYPAEHAVLQETIRSDHLLISGFEIGTAVHPGNFPERNRLMAELSMVTIIVEADNKSGTIHQARACEKFGKKLLIWHDIIDNPNISWYKEFSNYICVSNANEIWL